MRCVGPTSGVSPSSSSPSTCMRLWTPLSRGITAAQPRMTRRIFAWRPRGTETFPESAKSTTRWAGAIGLELSSRRGAAIAPTAVELDGPHGASDSPRTITWSLTFGAMCVGGMRRASRRRGTRQAYFKSRSSHRRPPTLARSHSITLLRRTPHDMPCQVCEQDCDRQAAWESMFVARVLCWAHVAQMGRGPLIMRYSLRSGDGAARRDPCEFIGSAFEGHAAHCETSRSYSQSLAFTAIPHQPGSGA